VDTPKKLLQASKVFFPFDLNEILLTLLSRIMPAFGDPRHVCRHIVRPNQLEARRPDQPFIFARRQKEVGANRTARRNFLVRQCPGDYHGVSVQHLATRLQYTEPIPQDVSSAWDMAHGVVGEDGIESISRVGQRLSGVHNLKMSQRVEILPAGEVVAVLDAVFVDVQPGDAAAGSSRDEQCRAA